jgi:hypothetical protein
MFLTLMCLSLVMWVVTTDFLLGLIFVERVVTALSIINLTFLMYKLSK